MTTDLIPCPACGLLHEATTMDLGIELIPCPFMPKDKAVCIGNPDSPRGIAVLDLGEPVGEPVQETPTQRAVRMLYGRRAA